MEVITFWGAGKVLYFDIVDAYMVLYESASCSVVSDSATPWTVARQAPLSMDFPGRNTGVGCHFLIQRNFPDSGIKSMSSVTSALPADFLPAEPSGKSGFIHM